MPIYPYKCHSCGLEKDFIKRVNDFNQDCPNCGQNMERQFHCQFGINMGPAGAHGYYDDTLGKYISTNRKHKEEMKRQGVSEKPSKKVWFR